MASVTFHETTTVNVEGQLPQKGQSAPDFTLTDDKLQARSLKDYRGKKVVLNIFPSIDTGVCAASVRRFNQEAAALDNSAVLCISADLPFAMARFCAAEGIENVETLSIFRAPQFKKEYGVGMTDGPLADLCARTVIVLDSEGRVVYTQQVAELTDEPDYAAALDALKQAA